MVELNATFNTECDVTLRANKRRHQKYDHPLITSEIPLYEVNGPTLNAKKTRPDPEQAEFS